MHTPGPWLKYATPHDLDFTHEIAGVAVVHKGVSSEANARLIAAAPELLEALKAALSTMELQVGREEDRYHLSLESMRRIWDAVVEQGDAAIKKATE